MKNYYEDLIVLRNYGKVQMHINEKRLEKKLSKYRISKLTGANYKVVSRYCKPDMGGRVDLDFLAKICYILECDISDLLTYQKEEEKN